MVTLLHPHVDGAAASATATSSSCRTKGTITPSTAIPAGTLSTLKSVTGGNKDATVSGGADAASLANCEELLLAGETRRVRVVLEFKESTNFWLLSKVEERFPVDAVKDGFCKRERS